MSNLMRLEAKYVRDGIKARYPKRVECRISGETEDLQLHHYHSVTLLWEKWKKENNVKIKDADDVMKYRNLFYQEHEYELLEDVVVLTDYWHNERLHKIYGVCPELHTAAKQRRWVERMRKKHYGMA